MEQKISKQLWNDISKNPKNTFVAYKWRLGLLSLLAILIFVILIIILFNKRLISLSMENTIILYSSLVLVISINTILYILEDAWFSFLKYKKISMEEKEKRHIRKIFQKNEKIFSSTKRELLQIKYSLESISDPFNSMCINLALEELDEYIKTIEKIEKKIPGKRYYAIAGAKHK